MDIRKMLRKKPSRGAESPQKPLGQAATSGSSLPYQESPGALQYPGVKSKDLPPEPVTPKSVEIPRPASSLPRCPGCGWSVGYTDEKCSNCGHILQQLR